MMIPCRCMTIAGSDSGGGAGIQGDLKTFAALGAYGMSVIAALTAQNSHEVRGVHDVPPAFVRQQLQTVLDDIPCDGAKTGMLSSAPIIQAVVEELASRPRFPLVVDPVMVSTSGARLLSPDAVEAVRVLLLPMATLATPNSAEAEVLAGFAIQSLEDSKRAAAAIHGLGCKAVLVKGGDFCSGQDSVFDVFYDGDKFEVFRSARLDTPNTHGSGCALAAAICVGLAKKLSVIEAIKQARLFVHDAIAQAYAIGSGPGPVNHLHHFTRHA